MDTAKDPDRHSDDDVNLERYSLVLAAWWREIVFSVFLVAAAGATAVLGLRAAVPKYESSADVAIIPTDTAVSIDDKFRAVAGDFQSRRRFQDRGSRRAALIGLVHNGAVAGRVLDRLSGRLEEERYPSARLLEAITTELVTIGAVSRNNQSDLIRIIASADSPERAAAIADAWAEEYVVEVNRLYERVPQDVITRVQNEMKMAEEAYGRIQAKLETITANNDIDRLMRKIEMNNQRIERYRQLWHETTNALFYEKIHADAKSLIRNYDIRQRLKGILEDALSLRGQIENGAGPGSASNELAVQLLKIQAYTMSGTLPEGLEIVLSGAGVPHTGDAMAGAGDIDGVINAIEQRIMRVDEDIDGQITDLTIASLTTEDSNENVPLNRMMRYLNTGGRQLEALIRELEEDNKILNKGVEATNANLKNLTEERDRTLTAVQTLRNEMVELQLTSVAAPSEVRLASPAVVPWKSSWPSPVLVAAVMGAAWMPAAILLALFLNALGIRPFIERRGA